MIYNYRYNDEIHYHPAPKYTFGLDLGQVKDYTALCILERHGEGDTAISRAPPATLRARHVLPGDSGVCRRDA